MENYNNPLLSTHFPYSEDYNYNKVMSSLQNLDLGYYGDQESSRNNNHGVFDASHYSTFSPRPQFLDHTNCEYDPSYVGGSTMNQNGYSNQDTVSMAMRHEGLMFLQTVAVVELVLCMRIVNEILRLADQKTPNRISGSVQCSPGLTRTRKIFVGGLASTVTESNFKSYFDQFGKITDVRVMYDHITKRNRGFGFITFDSEEAVKKVLVRNFHELNGKMVEVKRAAPKELCQISIRSQLDGVNYGLSRVSNLLSAYTQGYSPSQVGGSGLKMDGSFSPAAVGCRGYPSFSPGYGVGPNLEPGLGLNFEPSSFSPMYYFAKNSTNSAEFMGSGSGNTGLINAHGNVGAFRGSSPVPGQDRVTGTSFSNGNINFGNAESSFALGGVGYARNTRGNVAPSPASSSTAAVSEVTPRNVVGYC